MQPGYRFAHFARGKLLCVEVFECDDFRATVGTCKLSTFNDMIDDGNRALDKSMLKKYVVPLHMSKFGYRLIIVERARVFVEGPDSTLIKCHDMFDKREDECCSPSPSDRIMKSRHPPHVERKKKFAHPSTGVAINFPTL